PEAGNLRTALAREISRLPFQTSKSPRRRLGVWAGVKRRDSKIAFALGAEPRAGSDDHLDLFQDFVEHFPAVVARGCFHPDVGRISTAENFKLRCAQSLRQNFRIVKVASNQSPHFLLA